MPRLVPSLLLALLIALPASAASYSFNSNFSLGSSGSQVVALQQVLNSDVDTRVANSGPGSPGNETPYFGLLTKAAVERFQQKYASQILAPAGLTEANGFVGYYTRLVLNALLAGGTVSTPSTPVVSTTPTVCGVGELFNSLTGAPCSGTAVTPVTPTTLSTSFTPSLSGTTIPSATEIIDNQGNAWTEAGDLIYRNNIAVSYSSTFNLLLFSNGLLYQENMGCQWWVWNGSSWVQTTNPGLTVGDCTTTTTPVQTQAVNGSCGTSNALTFSATPSSNLCTSGSASSIGGSGPWSWSCLGSGGGINAFCAAGIATNQQTTQPTPIDGICGSSNNSSVSAAPSTNLCSSGSASTVGGSGPWSWSCSGSNGGGSAACVASKTTTTTTQSSVSASGTTIPSTTQIIDSAHNTWTVSNGVVYENGVPAGYSANVTLLLYYNGTVYQENSSQSWWSWGNGAWVVAGDPRVVASTDTGSTGSGTTSGGTSGGTSSGTIPSGVFGIQASGSELVSTKDGSVIHLRGADLSGLEYSEINNSINPTQVMQNQTGSATPWVAMKSWKLNVVRIPLNEQSFLGWKTCNTSWGYGGNGTPDPDGNYVSAIQNIVNGFTSNGFYVILDMHWSAPGNLCAGAQIAGPDTDNAPAFWTSVAKTFKNNPAVIFDLFNEPYVTWPCLKNGCSFSDMDVSGKTDYNYNWNVVGMQSLVNTVRATGATNLLMIGGISGADDLSQWLTYKPTDPLNQIAASWHYDMSSASAASGILAAGVPVIIGESGANSESNVQSMSGWVAQNPRAGILVWAWNTGWGMTTDSAGDAASPEGTYFKSWVEANQ
jgi:hypothetical protein